MFWSWIGVAVCFSTHANHNMMAPFPYMKTTKAHLSVVGESKIYSERQENTVNHLHEGKEGRFNLRFGTHSSFLQMKARKWKSLESCLVWKSKVMNNASVSIIKSVLIRWISPAPAGWKAHTAALLTNHEWDKSPWGALNLTSSLWDPHQSVGVSNSKQLKLVIYAHESTSNGLVPQWEQLIYTQLLIREWLSC